MKEFIEKLIGRLMKDNRIGRKSFEVVFEIVNQLAEEYKQCTLCYLQSPCEYQNENAILPASEFTDDNGWIPCSERLPECENGQKWVSCIVSVIRSHYPTSTYDVCDSPYDEEIVMHAQYDVSQKIWHLECDEQVNALINIEDAPLNCDYVIAWQPLPAPYQPKGE